MGSDSLTTGSERLVRVLRDAHPQIVMAPKRDVDSTIKADTGIVALVAYVVDDDCVCKDLERLAEMAGESPSKKLCGRCAAIKTWETGK